ncbi:MAG: MFS transporter [Patescibacteria group bacterium]
MSTSNSKTKRVLPILFITLFLDMIGTGMIFPIIPILLTDPSSPSFLLHGTSTGMQYLIAGLLTGVFGLMQFIAAPILGELSDVYGRKKLLTIGVGVLAIAQLIFGFAIVIASIPLLFLSRAIAGLAAANFSIAQATVADVTEPKDRAKNFGLIGVAFGLGFIVGPLLGGWMLHLTGVASAPFWLAGALGVLNLISITLFMPETRATSKEAHNFHFLKGIRNIESAIRDKDARGVYGATFLFQLGFGFFTSFIGILLVTRFNFSAGAVGTFFGIVGVWVIVTQAFILRIVTRAFTEQKILSVSVLMLAVGIFMEGFAPNVPFLYTAIPLVALGVGLSNANFLALVSKSVSADKQGAALGISGSLSALAQGVAPLAAGLGAGFFGLQLPFVIGMLLALASWAALFVFGKHRVVTSQ